MPASALHDFFRELDEGEQQQGADSNQDGQGAVDPARPGELRDEVLDVSAQLFHGSTFRLRCRSRRTKPYSCQAKTRTIRSSSVIATRTKVTSKVIR
jgi:hypothetical protein